MNKDIEMTNNIKYSNNETSRELTVESDSTDNNTKSSPEEKLKKINKSKTSNHLHKLFVY